MEATVNSQDWNSPHNFIDILKDHLLYFCFSPFVKIVYKCIKYETMDKNSCSVKLSCIYLFPLIFKTKKKKK